MHVQGGVPGPGQGPLDLWVSFLALKWDYNEKSSLKGHNHGFSLVKNIFWQLVWFCEEVVDFKDSLSLLEVH